MKTPKKEIEKAKTLLENYKERISNGEHFPNWDEIEKGFNFTEEETAKMNKKIQKISAKLTKKAEKPLEKYVKV